MSRIPRTRSLKARRAVHSAKSLPWISPASSSVTNAFGSISFFLIDSFIHDGHCRQQLSSELSTSTFAMRLQQRRESIDCLYYLNIETRHWLFRSFLLSFFPYSLSLSGCFRLLRSRLKVPHPFRFSQDTRALSLFPSALTRACIRNRFQDSLRLVFFPIFNDRAVHFTMADSISALLRSSTPLNIKLTPANALRKRSKGSGEIDARVKRVK